MSKKVIDSESTELDDELEVDDGEEDEERKTLYAAGAEADL